VYICFLGIGIGFSRYVNVLTRSIDIVTRILGNVCKGMREKQSPKESNRRIKNPKQGERERTEKGGEEMQEHKLKPHKNKTEFIKCIYCCVTNNKTEEYL